MTKMPISVDKFPSVPTLKYSDARSQIRSGDILMCSGDNWYSDLIKFATGSIWSHVGFILRLDIIDRIVVLESVEKIGVRMVPLSFYMNNYEGKGKPYDGKILIARHDDFKNAHTTNLAKKAIDLLGHNYNSNEIAKITTRIALSKFKSDDECKFPEPNNAFICSEYGYECFTSMGIHVNHDCRGFVTPADFAKTKEVNAVCEIR
jgi:hypothetical protein